MPWIELLLKPRILNLLAFLACMVAFWGALYLQHFEDLEPCPLCIFQRVAVIAASIFFLLAAIHNPGKTGQRVYAVLAGIGAGFGVFTAGRHVWLQGLPPDQVPACGPELGYMLDVFPMQDVVSMVLRGSGECAKVDWVFLGISLPGWSLVVMLGLSAVVAFQLCRPYKAN